MSANRRADISVGEMKALAAGLVGCDSGQVEEVAIVIVRTCPGCDEGHTAVTGTAEDEAELIGTLAEGISAVAGIWGETR